MYAVVIPSKDSRNLAACTAAIRECEPDPRIVLVDDGVVNIPAGVSLTVPGQKPFVFPVNINIGVRAALKQWPEVDGFVLCNDDCLLKTPGGFTLLETAHREHPEFGAIGAVTNVTGQPLQRPQGKGLRTVPHIAYICVYVPRSTFESVQWMDPRYCVDYGCCDLDHCQAITRAGLLVGVHDSVYVDHGSLHSSFRGDPRTPKSFQQNYALYKTKWGIR